MEDGVLLIIAFLVIFIGIPTCFICCRFEKTLFRVKMMGRPGSESYKDIEKECLPSVGLLHANSKEGKQEEK